MKSRQITALLLSAVMVISACIPAGIQAYAAEDAGASASSEIVEMTAPEEESGEEEAAQTAGDDGEQNIEDTQQTDKEEAEDITDDANDESNDESVQNDSEAGENEETEAESVNEEAEPEQEESVDAQADEEEADPSIETAEDADEETADDDQEPAAVSENNDAEDEEITEAVDEETTVEEGETAAKDAYDDATLITIGSSASAQVAYDDYAYFKFTPSQSATCRIKAESANGFDINTGLMVKDGDEYSYIDESYDPIYMECYSGNTYFITVYNDCISEDTITVTVEESPFSAYNATSSRFRVGEGENVYMAVGINTPTPEPVEGLTYVWTHDGKTISGADTYYYSFGVSASSVGLYECLVSKGSYVESVSFTVTCTTRSFKNAATLPVGGSAQVSVNENEPCAYYKFTPTASGHYHIFSANLNGSDPYVELYEFNGSDYIYLVGDDDSGEGLSFDLVYNCVAGKTYYINSTVYEPESDPGVYTINLKKEGFIANYVSSESFEVTPNTSVTLEAKADVNSVKYQWFLYDTPISGATGSKYAFNAQTGGTYNCEMTDGSYKKTLSFTVRLVDANGNEITDIKYSSLSAAACTYDGTPKKPQLTVRMNGYNLEEGYDYQIVSWANNVNAGTASVTLKGLGYYSGQAAKTFTIAKAAATKLTVNPGSLKILAGTSATFTVAGAKEALSVTSASSAVTASLAGNTVTVKGSAASVVNVTVRTAGKNYNQSSITVPVYVLPAATKKITATNQVKGIKLTWKKVPGATGYLVYRDKKLIKTVKGTSYTDKGANKNGKKYVFTIVAKAASGTSTKSKSLTTYRTARPGLKSVTSEEPNTIKITWSKNAKGNGYEILYGLKKNLKGAKKVKITKKATLQRLVKKLKSGKTYYVKVRAFKKAGGKKYYSAWSVTKKIAVK